MAYGLMQQVLMFHKTMGCKIGDPRFPDVTVDTQHRLDLIEEELQELKDALVLEGPEQRVIKTADALGDLLYVIAGAGAAWGIELGTVVDAIHDSNMTKTPGMQDSNGKVLKGPKYVAPDIKGALEQAAYEAELDGLGDDSWWPEPTVKRQEEPSQEVSDKIMKSAKEQAKILAMKNIKVDFVLATCCPVGELDGDNHAGSCIDLDDEDNEPTQVFHKSEKIVGQFTPYGAYVFDCTCGRKHAVSGKQGSRGGLAPKGKAECMCGNAFVVDFSTGEPDVTVTTIEELRKQEG